MADNYIGWKMFDTVTIVSRPITKWNYETHENIATGECQGFLVDPKNEKQLDSALSLGTSYEYEYTTNEDGEEIEFAYYPDKPIAVAKGYEIWRSKVDDRTMLLTPYDLAYCTNHTTEKGGVQE